MQNNIQRHWFIVMKWAFIMIVKRTTKGRENTYCACSSIPVPSPLWTSTSSSPLSFAGQHSHGVCLLPQQSPLLSLYSASLLYHLAAPAYYHTLSLSLSLSLCFSLSPPSTVSHRHSIGPCPIRTVSISGSASISGLALP